jgi:hypothetical protein
VQPIPPGVRKRPMTITKFNTRAVVVSVLLCLNAVLWIALWVNFGQNSRVVRSGLDQPDDEYTELIVGHRAASPAIYSSRNWSYRGAFVASLPSYLITHMIFNSAFGAVREPRLYLGTTVAGYELICCMIVSFLQWYLVGRLIGWLMSRRQYAVASA